MRKDYYQNLHRECPYKRQKKDRDVEYAAVNVELPDYGLARLVIVRKLGEGE
jgi:hypothetical protein